jgi:hypothetical protein
MSKLRLTWRSNVDVKSSDQHDDLTSISKVGRVAENIPHPCNFNIRLSNGHLERHIGGAAYYGSFGGNEVFLEGIGTLRPLS